ncbi:MAG TPA: bacillithiol system redox-active protein YtxJ [Vicinamibacteria bacterium]|nr:bacillithiol system redox-active protein YtxJ [Vicinamibacteria bacterium]
MKRLMRIGDVDALLSMPLAIVYKHSPLCGLSERARHEAERFLSNHPGQEIHEVDVIEDRQVSDYIETRTGIRHESPQIIVLRDGKAVWCASHSRVTAEAIASNIE